MKWPWSRNRDDSDEVLKARATKQRVDDLYSKARQPLREADEMSDRVISQLDQNHFGLLMRASMERR